MAPEILLGKGYTFACDFWSIGVICYEMVYGYYPFGEHSTDVMDIYKEIITLPVKFNDQILRLQAINKFMEKLLIKNQLERMSTVEAARESDLFYNDFKLVAL